jgi:hypothetical protein
LHNLKKGLISNISIAAKLLMKRTVLPALLGFKLKLSTLMPILLAGFFFMASKAVFFSKLAILIGASIGLKSLLFSGHLGGGHSNYGAYGLHPVGHSSDSFWDSFFGGGGGSGLHSGLNNPYGPVSFRAAPPEVLNSANDNVPRTLESKAEQRTAASSTPFVRVTDAKPLVVVNNGGQQRPTGKRNFAWEQKETKSAL